MKKLLTLFAITFFICNVFAQAPQKMSYQAVIRNSTGALVTNHTIGMKISILQGSSSGTPVYVESHTPTTNANGLATIEIGGGSIVSGTFTTIDWSNDTYYLKTETDPAGGTSYSITGTSQLLSVPYALHAKTVKTGDNWGTQAVISEATFSGTGTAASPLKLAQMGASTGQVLKWTGSAWDNANDDTGPWSSNDNYVYNSSGKYFGMGISVPTRKLTIADAGTEAYMNIQNSSTGYTNTDGVLIGMQGLNGWLTTYEAGDLRLGTNGMSRIIINSSGNVGIGTSSPGYKLDISGTANLNKGIDGIALRCNGTEAIWFNGTYFSWGYGGSYNFFGDKVKIGGDGNVESAYMLYVAGNAYTTGVWATSDARMKKNITTLENALNNLQKIRGTSFDYRDKEFSDYDFARGRQFGLIAQEIEAIFPELVNTDSKGYKSVNYNGMIPVFVEAFKDQQRIIDQVKSENEELKVRLERLEAKVGK